jgi:homoserine kinase
MAESIKVFAPATVANVTCGFDILGFAVDQPGDEVTLILTSTSKVKITAIFGDGGVLPLDPEKNTCGAVVKMFLSAIESDQGVDIILHKKMPLGSGLGSSAASAVAAVFGINKLMGDPMTNQQLLLFAMEGERIACGAAHADNVAPGLFGGFVLIRSYDPLDVVELPTPSELFATLVHPQIEVKTKDARAILRKQIFFEDSVKQSGNVAGLIAGLLMSDYSLISRSMQDYIVEPARSILIPGFEDVKEASMNLGAIGAGISGSGPSVFALSQRRDTALKIAQKMQELYTDLDIESETYVSGINRQGPRIL